MLCCSPNLWFTVQKNALEQQSIWSQKQPSLLLHWAQKTTFPGVDILWFKTVLSFFCRLWWLRDWCCMDWLERRQRGQKWTALVMRLFEQTVWWSSEAHSVSSGVFVWGAALSNALFDWTSMISSREVPSLRPLAVAVWEDSRDCAGDRERQMCCHDGKQHLWYSNEERDARLSVDSDSASLPVSETGASSPFVRFFFLWKIVVSVLLSFRGLDIAFFIVALFRDENCGFFTTAFPKKQWSGVLFVNLWFVCLMRRIIVCCHCDTFSALCFEKILLFSIVHRVFYYHVMILTIH